MTNSKLIDCTNIPWSPKSGLPDRLHILVSPDWNHAEMYRKHVRLSQEKETDLGFADWLLTQGATLAVAEKWDIPASADEGK